LEDAKVVVNAESRVKREESRAERAEKVKNPAADADADAEVAVKYNLIPL